MADSITAEKLRQITGAMAEKLEALPIEAHGHAIQELANGFQYRAGLAQKEAKEAHDAAILKAAQEKEARELEAKFSPRPVSVIPQQ